MRRQITKPVLLVMARYWAFGPVKTRLAADLGQPKARQIYKKLAETIWARTQDPRLDRWICCEPSGACQEMNDWLQGAEKILPQPPLDLGGRLEWAFEQAFAIGAPWAAVIGTDSPSLSAAHLLQVGKALQQADVVTIPTHDGGYALLALQHAHPELFRNIPWSTDQVHSLTLERALETGLSIYSLPAIQDIDTVRDLDDLDQESG
jgi:uncharacterized protein